MTQSPGMFGVTPCIRLLYKTLCSQAWSGTRTGWLIRWPSSRAHYKRTHYSANTFKLHSHTDTCTSSVAIHQGNLRLHVCQIGWKSARKFSKYTSQNKRLHFFPDKVCLVRKKAVRMDIIVILQAHNLEIVCYNRGLSIVELKPTTHLKVYFRKSLSKANFQMCHSLKASLHPQPREIMCQTAHKSLTDLVHSRSRPH